MNKFIIILSLGFLVLCISLFAVIYFVFDIGGTGIFGLYKCQYKEIRKVKLDNYYSPVDTLRHAQAVKYTGHVNRGFGEPDDQGSSVVLKKNINGREYSIILSRLPDDNWKTSLITSISINNSCTTPNATIKKELSAAFDELKIQNDWVYRTPVKLFYDIPWFQLPL